MMMVLGNFVREDEEKDRLVKMDAGLSTFWTE